MASRATWIPSWSARRYSLAEFASDLSGNLAPDELGGMVVLNLDDANELTPAAILNIADRISMSTDIVIGAAQVPTSVPDELLDAAAFTLAPISVENDRRIVQSPDLVHELGRLTVAVRNNPYASTVLAQVLRTASRLSVTDALRVESFAYSMLLGGAEFAKWLAGRGPRVLPIVPYDCVHVERVHNALQVTLNNADRRNAYSAQIRDGLVEALQLALVDTNVSELHLSGNGPDFCSGGDLAEFGTGPGQVVSHLIRTAHSVGSLLDRLNTRMAVRVYLHGRCIGAGIEVPSFASRVIAHPNTSIRLPEISMGLIPGAGGTVSLTRRIGRWRTAYLALSGRTLHARQALRWGLVDDLDASPPSQAVKHRP